MPGSDVRDVLGLGKTREAQSRVDISLRAGVACGDCNDIPDTWVIDDDLDGEIDYLLKDSNGDGTWDMKITEQKDVGIIYVFYNSEKTVSAIGYDYDQDGVIDRFTAP